jgi:type 1 glutamine amidotransferase
MLVYSITKAFKHDSIAAGQTMLQDIGKAQGFEVTVAQNNSEITAAGLEKYEIVFFMNSTGDIFNETEQKAYETWITTKNGAFAGVHAATDTESGWAFYKEVTGQYYDQHDPVVAPGTIQWQAGAMEFIAVKGLPSPWQRNEEWYRFNSYTTWSQKAGFKVLSLVTTSGGGTRPVSYIREYGNFRSFYTSLGHEAGAFQDTNVRKHVAAGIMWAVRREALLK